MAPRQKEPRRDLAPPTSEERPFFDAVLSKPDDDAPRLVYADWLQEEGELERGELIGVQCTRARLERDDETTTTEYRRACARERELLLGFVHNAYMNTFGARGPALEWRRGFLARIRMASVTALREHWPLFGSHPLERVDVTDGRAGRHHPPFSELHWLAASPPGKTLRTLDLSGHHGSVELDARAVFGGAETVAGGVPTWEEEATLPHPMLLPFVTSVSYPHPTDARFAGLVETPLPSLRSFGYATTPRLQAVSLAPIVDAPLFAKLERIACARLPQGDALLLLARARGGLRALAINSDYPWDFEAVVTEALTACEALSSLEELAVDVAYDVPLVLALDRRAPRLERLTIGAGPDPAALEAFGASAVPARLRHLTVAGIGRAKPSAAPIARAAFTRLTSLDLTNLTLDADLAAAPALETLTELRLRRCVIAPAVGEAIMKRWPHTEMH